MSLPKAGLEAVIIAHDQPAGQHLRVENSSQS
jgi:hypothetical protein